MERGKKHYVNVKNVETEAKFEDYLVELKTDSIAPVVIKTINHIVNANRNLIYVENKAHFVDVISKIAQELSAPFFEKIAIQDILYKNCEQN